MSTLHEERAIAIRLGARENNHDPSEPLEELQSALILAYERALEQGISPIAAIAAIIDIASLEARRLITPRLEK